MTRQWLLVSSVCVATLLATPVLAKRNDAQPTRPVASTRPTLRFGKSGKPPDRGADPTPAKLAKQVAGKGPCLARPVQLVRARGAEVEPFELSLTLCNGKPNVAVLDALSVLARPRDVPRPRAAELRAYHARPLARGKVSAKSKIKYRDPTFVSERVMRLHPGLLVRLQRLANHYPGKIIEIVSGYRPDARDTSRHHHGRALDLRVAGIAREKLRDYLRTLDGTGVGYYPNSYFVHMDVRDIKGYWVDRSGPGEPADYGPWPATLASTRQLGSERNAILKGAFAELAQLGKPVPERAADAREPLVRRSVPPVAKARVREPEQEADDMSEEEVARVRAEARAALEGL